MFPLILYCTGGHCLSKKFFTTHETEACFCFYVMEFRKQKNIFCTSEASLWFTQKNNFCIMNNQTGIIKLAWFIHYSEINFLSINIIFLYILKIFFTMVHLRIFLEYWINFQNIVVCNEPLRSIKEINRLISNDVLRCYRLLF